MHVNKVLLSPHLQCMVRLSNHTKRANYKIAAPFQCVANIYSKLCAVKCIKRAGPFQFVKWLPFNVVRRAW